MVVVAIKLWSAAVHDRNFFILVTVLMVVIKEVIVMVVVNNDRVTQSRSPFGCALRFFPALSHLIICQLFTYRNCVLDILHILNKII